MKKQLFIVLSALCCLLSTHVLGQELSISGNAGTKLELYRFNPSDTSLQPRRPNLNYRLFANPIVQIGENVRIPFNIMLTKRQPNTLIPLPTSAKLFGPNNMVGVSPTFGWAQFHAGSHVARFSELSTGDMPIVGGGFDLKPGKFRLAYSQGTMQSAIQPDTTLNLHGVFKQKVQALKIGFGSEQGSFFYLNAVKRQDEPNSIHSSPMTVKATMGTLLTTNFQLRLAPNVSVSGEVGGSAFTKDQAAQSLGDDDLAFLPDYLFKSNLSSRADFAGTGKLNFDYPTWGLTFQTKYLGPGYEPLGYAFVETDIFHISVSPRLRLFKGRFIFNGSFGQRRDNLAQTKLATSKRVIASAHANAIFNPAFSTSFQYTNYGMRNNVDNDTLKLEFVSSNISATPTYRFKSANGAYQSISVTFGKSTFEDKNLLTGEFGDNNTTTFNCNYSVTFGKTTSGFSIVSVNNKRPNGNLQILSGSLRIGHLFFERKLNVSTSVGYGRVNYELFTSDTRFNVRPSIRYRMTNKSELSISGNFRMYQYGSQRNDASFSESLMRFGLRSRF